MVRPCWSDGPRWSVVDHDRVRQVDVAVGAFEVRAKHFALDLLPRHEVVLVRVWKVERGRLLGS